MGIVKGIAYAALLSLLALIVAVAVATAEPLGSIGILQRSWHLTSGSWWRLFLFLLLFLVAVFCVMVAVGAVIGILAGIVLGPPEPMSVSALVIALITQLAVAAVTVVFLVMLTRIYLQLAARTVTVPETAA